MNSVFYDDRNNRTFKKVHTNTFLPRLTLVCILTTLSFHLAGTGTNVNKEILEEAYIMASVDHLNLLQLLAVCMTTQIMLVTQLMPLGCLLDYVRNNKDKVRLCNNRLLAAHPLIIFST